VRKLRKLLRDPRRFLQDLRLARRLGRRHPTLAGLGGAIRFGPRRDLAPGIWRSLVFGAPQAEWPALDAAYPEFEKLFVSCSARLSEVAAELGTGRYDLLLIWGCSSGRLLQRLGKAAQPSLPILNVLPGPLPRLPEADELRSYALDWRSPYINARRPGDLHLLLGYLDFDLTERALKVAEDLVAGSPLDGARAWPPRRILAILQDPRDPEFLLGSHDRLLPRPFLDGVRERYPDATIVALPTSPFDSVSALAAAVPAARGTAELLPYGSRLETAVRDADLVVTVSSGQGLEALLRGCRVATFGSPWYSGWGLTQDCNPPPRPRTLSLAQLVAAAVVLYPRWIDTRSNRLIGLEQLQPPAVRRALEARAA
jgi:capsule polysaccharide export protein KpsC/LpsZ